MAKTWADLRSDIRLRIGDVVTVSNQNFSDADIDNFLFYGVGRAMALIESLDEHYFQKDYTIPIVAGQVVILIPTEIRKILDVRREGTNRKFTFIEPRDKRTNVPLYGYPHDSYQLYFSGSNAQPSLTLADPARESFNMLIISSYDILENDFNGTPDTQVSPFPHEGNLVAVLYACIQALGSENGQTTFWSTAYTDAVESLKQHLETRHKTEPRYVRYIHDES